MRSNRALPHVESHYVAGLPMRHFDGQANLSPRRTSDAPLQHYSFNAFAFTVLPASVVRSSSALASC